MADAIPLREAAPGKSGGTGDGTAATWRGTYRPGSHYTCRPGEQASFTRQQLVDMSPDRWRQARDGIRGAWMPEVWTAERLTQLALDRAAAAFAEARSDG